MYIIIGSLCLLVVAVLIGVLVTAQRKRVHGLTWFPENFLSRNSAAGTRRKSPDGGEEPGSDCKLDGTILTLSRPSRPLIPSACTKNVLNYRTVDKEETTHDP